MQMTILVFIFFIVALFLGGLQPVPGDDVYGYSQIATLAGYGAYGIGMGVGAALLWFPAIYYFVNRRFKLNFPMGKVIGLYFIAAFAMGPMVRFLAGVAGDKGNFLHVIAIFVVPSIVSALVILISKRELEYRTASGNFTSDYRNSVDVSRNSQIGSASEFAAKNHSVLIAGQDNDPRMLPVTKSKEDNIVHLYDLVGKELETGEVDRAIWTKVFAESDGDEAKTKAAYIRFRIAALSVSVDSPASAASTSINQSGLSEPSLVSSGFSMPGMIVVASLVVGLLIIIVVNISTAHDDTPAEAPRADAPSTPAADIAMPTQKTAAPDAVPPAAPVYAPASAAPGYSPAEAPRADAPIALDPPPALAPPTPIYQPPTNPVPQGTSRPRSAILGPAGRSSAGLQRGE